MRRRQALAVASIVIAATLALTACGKCDDTVSRPDGAVVSVASPPALSAELSAVGLLIEAAEPSKVVTKAILDRYVAGGTVTLDTQSGVGTADEYWRQRCTYIATASPTALSLAVTTYVDDAPAGTKWRTTEAASNHIPVKGVGDGPAYYNANGMVARKGAVIVRIEVNNAATDSPNRYELRRIMQRSLDGLTTIK
jgi:hypothetical protein